MRKLFFLLFILPCLLSAQKTVIYCGKLIDPKNLIVLNEMSIVVDGNKIIDVQKGYITTNTTDKIIDLKTKTVMPGLIDCHVHMDHETNPDRTLRFSQNEADIALEATKFCKTTLMAGFTTVRDLGGSTTIALRNAINKGYIIGPRIFAAGKPLSSTGGHGDGTNGLKNNLMHIPELNEDVVNGIDECVKMVRQRYKEGADVIKMHATGGVLSLEKDGSGAQFSEEEMKAIVTTAKDYGLKVAAHAHGAEGIKRAIRAGVASIEHGTYIDDEGIDLMKKMGTYHVPTIIAGKSVADSAKKPGYYPPIIAKKATEVGSVIQHAFAKTYKAGVKIAFGTDAGVYEHGKNWMEFVYMNEAGMPALECIKAATISAADLLGNDMIGNIEKGKYADIIAVDGDPVKDLHEMKNVKFVMKEGKVFKNE
ncbi:MAG: amidohydrolase family protein [Bacteroidetes bacterium]|nr:amidohydrolase family protein [Bacteroidota bacterium]MBS1649373.1 amidohydrolase family protein [Bacteroidota bacterium]